MTENVNAALGEPGLGPTMRSSLGARRRKEDAAGLNRNLWEEGLCREIYAGEKLHVVEHPPTDSLHLFAGISEDPVRQQDRHHPRAGFEKLVASFDEENFGRNFLLEFSLCPGVARLGPTTPEVELLENFRVIDRDLGAEGRSREDEIEFSVAAAASLECGGRVGFSPRDAELEAVETSDVPVRAGVALRLARLSDRPERSAAKSKDPFSPPQRET